MSKILLDSEPQQKYECPFYHEFGGMPKCGVKQGEYCFCVTGSNFDFKVCPFCKALNK